MMKMRRESPGHMGLCGALLLGLSIPTLAAEGPVVFEAQTLDDDVQIGYGTAIGDVDGDGRPDILLADKKQFVWYQNPDWRRHVMAENLTPRDNVCIAARDIDGDGKVDVAVGGEWNPGDTVGSGAVFYLDPPADRTRMWTPIRLHHEPVVHRMRWVKLDEGEYVLVVAPLHGRANENGEGAGVKLLAYEKPDNPRDEWATSLLEDTLHVTHNLDPVQWDPTTSAEEILYLGREGAMVLSYDDGDWTSRRFEGMKGGGEIRMGLHSPSSPFVVTIEPLHGDTLAYYGSSFDRGNARGGQTALTHRAVLDDNLKQGHAIATADLFGTGAQQVVAGWRNPNRDGKVGIRLYYPTDEDATEWTFMAIDDNAMATEDIRIGDLNDDGRLDIVAAGRSTHNLKIYWNRGPGK